MHCRVNNVGGLDERLRNMEKSLLMLADAMKEKEGYFLSSNHDNFPTMTHQRVNGTESSAYIGFTGDQLLNSYAAKLADLCQSELTSLRYTPYTLNALCEETHDILMSDLQVYRNSNDGIANLLTELRHSGNTEQLDNIEYDSSPILLPPKQLLAMACASFFQPGDLLTDLFCHSSFWANVDRIYSSPISANDDAWAVCFNLIILLGVGAEQSNSDSSVEFLKPLMLNITRAFRCTTLFLTPKLINLQTLALLVSSAPYNSQYPKMNIGTKGDFLEPCSSAVFPGPAIRNHFRSSLHAGQAYFTSQSEYPYQSNIRSK